MSTTALLFLLTAASAAFVDGQIRPPPPEKNVPNCRDGDAIDALGAEMAGQPIQTMEDCEKACDCEAWTPEMGQRCPGRNRPPYTTGMFFAQGLNDADATVWGEPNKSGNWSVVITCGCVVSAAAAAASGGQTEKWLCYDEQVIGEYPTFSSTPVCEMMAVADDYSCSVVCDILQNVPSDVELANNSVYLDEVALAGSGDASFSDRCVCTPGYHTVCETPKTSAEDAIRSPNDSAVHFNDDANGAATGDENTTPSPTTSEDVESSPSPTNSHEEESTRNSRSSSRDIKLVMIIRVASFLLLAALYCM